MKTPATLRAIVPACAVTAAAKIRMKIIVTAAALAAVALTAFTTAPPASAPPEDTVKFLPEIEGWTKDGDPMVYVPETLFEYIDGAADAYLAYEFEELAALSYNGGEKRSITVEVYRHRDLRNAFGIYSQERPQKGNFVDIGTQGYYDTGVLNFFHGPYYVKVMGYYLGNDDQAVLTTTARKIAERLGGPPAFPGILACFPTEGRVSGSERYISRDVLGHGFLHSAYAADYAADPSADGSPVRLFLFEGRDETDARKMLDDYLKLADASPSTRVEAIGPDDTTGPPIYRFTDPRRTTGERANFLLSGRFIWGLFASDAATADRYLERFEENLRAGGFIE